MKKRILVSMLAMALSGSVLGADTTASGLRGKITGPAGEGTANTKIVITHVASGTTKTVTTTENGSFNMSGLRVGGPYKVFVDSDVFEDQTFDDIYLRLGEVSKLNVQLVSESQVLVVTGSQFKSSSFGRSSPASYFNLDDLEFAASADRDIKDVIRIDPRISIAEADGDEAIICGGSNPRFSSLTVDGVRMNDSFGLNFNGYPTTRIPFSFDSISQIAVEIAPFDVQYGGFTGCNINAVTRSGTNEIHGGVFVDYTNDSLTGDEIEGEKNDLGKFSNKRYGFNIGLPLIKNKLFFYSSYEKLDGVQIFTYEALNSGAVTIEDVNRAIQISQDVYGYDPGGMPASGDVEDDKLLLKLDWNINEFHRASFVYNYNDGFLIEQSDESNTALTLSNHFYKKGAKLNSTVVSLYSDWSNNFSTEVRVADTRLDNVQRSVDADSGFGEVRIENLPNGNSSSGRIYIGPDDSRQTNQLHWENQTFKLAGTYNLENHTLTGGYEREDLDIFNIFMQHTIGEFRFGSFGRNGLDDFENGRVDDIYYNNSAGTNIPNDAAANFSYATNALYLQDDWNLDNIDLSLTFGLRYDWITSSDAPNNNPLFQERYGFSNQETFDGKSLLQPRFSFNYTYSEDIEFRGGFGLYQGGNPNVWLANSYSNDGVTNIDTYRGDRNILDANGDPLPGVISGDGRALFNPLNEQVDEVAGNDPRFGSEPSINAIDPDFELPSEWKYSFGLTYALGDGYVIQADALYTKKQDSATIIDLSKVQVDPADTGTDFTVGNTIDGRPIYENAIVGVDDNGFSVRRSTRKNDFLLTNAPKDGDSTTLSIAMVKKYDFGLNVNVGYAYNKTKEYNPMTSAVSFSNYTNIATSDPLNPGVSSSNYEVPHNFTFNLRYGVDFVDGYTTSFSLFGSRKKGRPISYTFGNFYPGERFSDTSAFRHLAYIPTQADYDSGAVTFATPEDRTNFDALVADLGLEGYRGKILPRNGFSSPWTTRIDFRMDQDLPSFAEGHSASAYFIIKNLGNFINDDWGITKQGSFVGDAIVDARLQDDGSYEYSDVSTPDLAVFQRQSLWEIKVGVKYQF